MSKPLGEVFHHNTPVQNTTTPQADAERLVGNTALTALLVNPALAGVNTCYTGIDRNT